MKSKQKKKQILFLFSTLIFSIFVVMTVKVYPIAADRHHFLQYTIPFSLQEDWKVWLVAVIITGIAVKYLLAFVSKTSIIEAKEDEDFTRKQKKLFFFSFFLSCFSWFWIFLLLFPGAAMNDTINCMMSPVKASSMQPLIFELIVYWGLYLIEKIVGNIVAAYAILTLFHMLFCAFALAYAVAWMYGKRIKCFICYFLAVLFACSPIVADYSVTLVKDVCFAYFFLLLLLQSYDIVAQKDRALTWGKAAKLAVLMVLVTLFRTNGIVVTAFLSIIYIVKHMDRKKILVVILAVAGISRLNHVVVSYYNPQSVAFRESAGVLTQQMAAVVARDGDISKEELEFLNQVLPIEQWKECYSFSFVDAIKFNAAFDNQFLNDHKIQYIKTWFSLLRKNLKIYIDAYLFQTYQLWNLASFDRSCVDYTQSVFTKVNNNTTDDGVWGKYLESVGLSNRSIYPQAVADSLKDTFIKACELNMLISPGWIILILSVCVCFLWSKGCWAELFFLMPSLLMWLFFMVAVPLAGPYRYSYYLLVALPFSVLIAWKGINEKQEMKERG